MSYPYRLSDMLYLYKSQKRIISQGNFCVYLPALSIFLIYSEDVPDLIVAFYLQASEHIATAYAELRNASSAAKVGLHLGFKYVGATGQLFL